MGDTTVHYVVNGALLKLWMYGLLFWNGCKVEPSVEIFFLIKPQKCSPEIYPYKWKKGGQKVTCRGILQLATLMELHDTVGSLYFYIFSGKKTVSHLNILFSFLFFLLNFNVNTSTKQSTEIHKKPKSIRNYLRFSTYLGSSSTLLVSVIERLTCLPATFVQNVHCMYKLLQPAIRTSNDFARSGILQGSSPLVTFTTNVIKRWNR
jgi:hypothetical protein